MGKLSSSVLPQSDFCKPAFLSLRQKVMLSSGLCAKCRKLLQETSPGGRPKIELGLRLLANPH